MALSDATNANAPIVLTTDFGLADPYAGVMKGVILGINPAATLIDLSHQIHPQNIRQAAFILGASYRLFPQGSIHVAVVDPGVGTGRRALLVETPTAYFLAPDNGLLSYVLRDYLGESPGEQGRVSLPANWQAYQLTNERYWLHPVSNTFHGRDIFAPVAAHLSLGVPAHELGEPVSEVVWLPAPQLSEHDGTLHGEVIYADHYGNLVTNVPAERIGDAAATSVEIKGHRISGVSRTFQTDDGRDSETLLALLGSLGYLEIAVANGNAAQILDAGPGEPVRVTPSRPS